MSKVFRLYTNGTNTVQDWGSAVQTPYNSATIAQIQDPNGAKNEITSIPSPFARIDLVKLAFREVCNSGNLTGTSIYHKMVSDALDVGEIFFNYNKLKDKIQMIEWNRSAQLAQLQHSPSKGHNIYSDALSKYLVADAKHYNFDRMDAMYILDYIGPGAPHPHNVIGATSPATIFFGNANDLNYVSRAISFGQRSPFDNNYQPLYKRDFSYVKWWFLVRFMYPSFSTDFPEVYDYLRMNEQQFQSDNHKMNVIRNLQADDMKEYEHITINGGASIVNVLGIEICRKQNVAPTRSDFFIRSTLCEERNKPMVLPVDTGNRYDTLWYVTDKWSGSFKADYKVDCEPDKRQLPFDQTSYPYLTISDFLEDYIVRVPHRMNAASFFNGNYEGPTEEEFSYLLPLSDLFFRYFTVDELRSKMNDGNKMFEMTYLAGGSVKVILRIPVSSTKRVDYIEYTRLYIDSQPRADITATTNKGGVVDAKFDMALFPNIRYRQAEGAYYSAGIVSIPQNSYHILFCDKGMPCKESEYCCRESGLFKTTTAVIDDQQFSYLRIQPQGNVSGVVIPLMKHPVGQDAYHFAVDLGTTNTHVEYTVNGALLAKPLEMAADESQIARVFVSSDDMGTFDQDFLPESLGGRSEYKLPIRTVYSVTKNVSANEALVPLANSNIPFTYDKKPLFKYNNYFSNIKWDNNAGNSKILEAYIKSLMLLLRNKVMLNGGDPSLTEITWFYPISMSEIRFHEFEQIWKRLFVYYFKAPEAHLYCITESIAPSRYYLASNASVSNFINIDIGGGTSDVSYIADNKVQYITSFRFAANSIFGDSFISAGGCNNGMVSAYREKVEQIFYQARVNELPSILQDLKDQGRSADIASFLFSLRQNSEILQSGIDAAELDFSGKLQRDERYKVVFVFFFTAIIYHIAHIVKARNLHAPRHITFSGNGAKVVRILTPDNNTLSDFAKLIFEQVLGYAYEPDGLDIILQDNPKEATCKGGLVMHSASEVDFSDIERKKVVLKAVDNATFVAGERYSAIRNAAYVEQVRRQVMDFIDFFIGLNDTFSFVNKFGASRDTLSSISHCCGDILTFIDKGIEDRVKEVGSDAIVEETLFFYPIVGVMNTLINYLSSKEE